MTLSFGTCAEQMGEKIGCSDLEQCYGFRSLKWEKRTTVFHSMGAGGAFTSQEKELLLAPQVTQTENNVEKSHSSVDTPNPLIP